MQQLRKVGFLILLLVWSPACIHASSTQDAKTCFIDDACRYYSTFFDWGCRDMACLCQDDAFLQTVVQCIYTYVPKEQLTSSWQKTEAYCKIAKNLDLERIKRLVENPNTKFLPPTEVLRPAEPYNDPMLLSSNKILPYAKFLEIDTENYRYDQIFSWLPLVFIFSVLFIQTVVHTTAKLFPKFTARLNWSALTKFRQKLILAPLGKYHHMKKHTVIPLMPKTTIPTRTQSLIVAGLFFVNVFFLMIKMNCGPPNPLMQSKLGMYTFFIGRRSGWLCFVQMILLLVFSARNNIWIRLTGWPLDTFNVFHKWVGIMSVFQVLVHSVGYYISYKTENRWDERITQAWMQWGVAGTVFFCLIPPLAFRYARQYNYELFLFLHIALSILVLVASWMHLSELKLGYGYLAAMVLIWAFDRLARLIRSVLSGLFCKSTVEMLPGNELLRMEVEYSKNWKWYPGSYAFVHIMTPQLFLQSHPFTMLKTPDDKLVLYVRIMNGATKSLATKAMQHLRNNYTVNVVLDGPYGETAPLKHYHTVLLVAGGVGVTFTLAHAMELISLSKQDTTVERIIFVWVIQDKTYIENFSKELVQIEDKRVEFRFFVTRSNTGDVTESESRQLSKNHVVDIETKVGRPNLSELVSAEMFNARGPLAVAVCGPETMSDDVRSTVVNHLDKCPYRVEYVEDAFTW